MSPFSEIYAQPPHHLCIVEDTTALSYGEAVEAVQRVSRALGNNGVVPQSVVGLRTNRDASSIITLLALLEMRCSVVLLHGRWPDAMIRETLTRCLATHLVRPATLDAIDIKPVSNSGSIPSWATGAAVIVATSGSTGVPKLALLSLSALLASARSSAPACRLSSDDRWHLSLPLFHVGGLGVLFRSLVTGSAVSLSDGGERDEGVTHLSLVPTQLYRLLTEPAAREALRRKRCIMLGGAPIGGRLLLEALQFGIPVMTTYGLTEMGSAVTLAPTPSVSEDGVVPLGLALPGREIRLSADGEVLTRGETLFRGYITGEELSLPLVEVDWFPTGDIGRILPDGTLAIIGRRDAQFISGGENIHPEMIESALTCLPGVVAACVVPVHDDEFGDRPFAFVVSESGSLDIDQIREALRPLLPSFALPIAIREAPLDLLTPSGKISRALALQCAKGSSARWD
jgi:O-succinylbenzoic acid--CoA ligase